MASCTPRSTSWDRPWTSTRAATAGRSRTRPTRWPGSSPRSRARTAGSGSRASTTRSWPSPTKSTPRIAELPFDEDEYRERRHVGELVGEVGYSTLERRATRPTLDVNGLWGGFQGHGTKTIIPAHAHAKVSSRLVPAQEPHDIFEKFRDFVLEIAPPGVDVTVQDLGGGRPSRTPIDHPMTKAAARALEATFGRAPVYIREGGSIPVTASFESILGLPVVLLGIRAAER